MPRCQYNLRTLFCVTALAALACLVLPAVPLVLFAFAAIPYVIVTPLGYLMAVLAVYPLALAFAYWLYCRLQARRDHRRPMGADSGGDL